MDGSRYIFWHEVPLHALDCQSAAHVQQSIDWQQLESVQLSLSPPFVAFLTPRISLIRPSGQVVVFFNLAFLLLSAGSPRTGFATLRPCAFDVGARVEGR